MDWEKERKIIDRVLARQQAKQSTKMVNRSISHAWDKYLLLREEKNRELVEIQLRRREAMMVSPAYRIKDRWQ